MTLPPLSPPNFFEALDLPLRLELDPARLEERYHVLSRALHPDYHQQASPAQQRAVMERSALVNQAYRALRDPMSRAEHLLSLFRPGVEKGADKGETPKDLLMAVFELQEIVEEADSLSDDAGSEANAALRARLDEVTAQLDARAAAERVGLGRIATGWDALPRDASGRPTDAAARDALLDRIAALLNERAYMRRLRGNIAQAMEKLGG